MTTNTQGGPQVAQLLKLLHEFKSSSVRINVGPFATLLRRWKLVWDMPAGSDGRIGHHVAAKFVPWILTADQKQQCINFCTELHQLASDNETFLSRVMRGGFMVTTLRQNDNPPSRKAPRHQGQKRPDR